VPYIETSAKDPPVNVDLAFHDVVRVIRYATNNTNIMITVDWKTFVTAILCHISYNNLC